MHSSDQISRPIEWSARRWTGRLVLSVAALTVFALPALFIAAGGLVVGDPYMAKYGVLFSCFFLSVILMPVVANARSNRMGSIRTMEWNGVSATVIEQSRIVFSSVAMFFLAAAALCLSAAADIFRHGGGGGTIVVGIMLTGLGCVAGCFLPMMLVGRIRCGRPVLTPSVIHQRGWSLESTLEWHSILVVRPAALINWAIVLLGHPAAQWERRTTMPRGFGWDALPPMPMIEVYCHKHPVDPVLLYALLLFYFENPEYRTELGTEAALERVRANRWHRYGVDMKP
ncbi:hypothetical protein [Rhodococcus chondri]|uniref:Uncharacterized protein n=1 Tax=Rhodococcus chondri TaxID=3065941 RepID=A0ABU7JVK4_9NOCA|nr:hypothetical protein [Rhodococcus sp. CC-R104]MEE2033865.1 hypothetical protein [Rhodococcus sp. CC-R104]